MIGKEKLSPANGMRILVVEDWWVVAEELRARLERLQCQVVGPVPTLQKAVRLAESEKLDGAILDVDLNGNRVYPVADVLIRRGIPFIFATGFDSPHVSSHYQGIPQLRKPYSFEELESAVQEAFQPTESKE
jgi:DNA-binding response OmpR family regulator